MCKLRLYVAKPPLFAITLKCVLYYICFLPWVFFACIFLHCSAILIITGNYWGGGEETKKPLPTSTWETISHRMKTRGWEITTKLETCNMARCADNSDKEEVDLVGSPHHGVQEKTGQSKINEPPKNPKQSKWAKHILPCSPQDMLTMVTASTGNSYWETDFSIATCSNCSGYCKTYQSIFLVLGRRGRIVKVLSGQENIIWQWFGS